MPIDAPKEQFSPDKSAITLPNVDPTKNTGTISPPLNPAHNVNAVNSSFNANASGFAGSVNDAVMIPPPAPL